MTESEKPAPPSPGTGDEDRWRLHSIALQRPATMGLARLLPECGFWKGTMVGYSGPPPEHATPPTRNYN